MSGHPFVSIGVIGAAMHPYVYIGVIGAAVTIAAVFLAVRLIRSF